jgi:hypothetical protein
MTTAQPTRIGKTTVPPDAGLADHNERLRGTANRHSRVENSWRFCWSVVDER